MASQKVSNSCLWKQREEVCCISVFFVWHRLVNNSTHIVPLISCSWPWIELGLSHDKFESGCVHVEKSSFDQVFSMFTKLKKKELEKHFHVHS